MEVEDALWHVKQAVQLKFDVWVQHSYVEKGIAKIVKINCDPGVDIDPP